MRPAVKWEELTECEKVVRRLENNPKGLQVGPYTGRCARCESKDLWDDATWYGCNYCGALYPNG